MARSGVDLFWAFGERRVTTRCIQAQDKVAVDNLERLEVQLGKKVDRNAPVITVKDHKVTLILHKIASDSYRIEGIPTLRSRKRTRGEENMNSRYNGPAPSRYFDNPRDRDYQDAYYSPPPQQFERRQVAKKSTTQQAQAHQYAHKRDPGPDFRRPSYNQHYDAKRPRMAYRSPESRYERNMSPPNYSHNGVDRVDSSWSRGSASQYHHQDQYERRGPGRPQHEQRDDDWVKDQWSNSKWSRHEGDNKNRQTRSSERGRTNNQNTEEFKKRSHSQGPSTRSRPKSSQGNDSKSNTNSLPNSNRAKSSQDKEDANGTKPKTQGLDKTGGQTGCSNFVSKTTPKTNPGDANCRLNKVKQPSAAIKLKANARKSTYSPGKSKPSDEPEIPGSVPDHEVEWTVMSEAKESPPACKKSTSKNEAMDDTRQTRSAKVNHVVDVRGSALDNALRMERLRKAEEALNKNEEPPNTTKEPVTDIPPSLSARESGEDNNATPTRTVSRKIIPGPNLARKVSPCSARKTMSVSLNQSKPESTEITKDALQTQKLSPVATEGAKQGMARKSAPNSARKSAPNSARKSGPNSARKSAPKSAHLTEHTSDESLEKKSGTLKISQKTSENRPETVHNMCPPAATTSSESSINGSELLAISTSKPSCERSTLTAGPTSNLSQNSRKITSEPIQQSCTTSSVLAPKTNKDILTDQLADGDLTSGIPSEKSLIPSQSARTNEHQPKRKVGSHVQPTSSVQSTPSSQSTPTARKSAPNSEHLSAKRPEIRMPIQSHHVNDEHFIQKHISVPAVRIPVSENNTDSFEVNDISVTESIKALIPASAKDKSKGNALKLSLFKKEKLKNIVGKVAAKMEAMSNPGDISSENVDTTDNVDTLLSNTDLNAIEQQLKESIKLKNASDILEVENAISDTKPETQINQLSIIQETNSSNALIKEKQTSKEVENMTKPLGSPNQKDSLCVNSMLKEHVKEHVEHVSSTLKHFANLASEQALLKTKFSTIPITTQVDAKKMVSEKIARDTSLDTIIHTAMSKTTTATVQLVTGKSEVLLKDVQKKSAASIQQGKFKPAPERYTAVPASLKELEIVKAGVSTDLPNILAPKKSEIQEINFPKVVESKSSIIDSGENGKTTTKACLESSVLGESGKKAMAMLTSVSMPKTSASSSQDHVDESRMEKDMVKSVAPIIPSIDVLGKQMHREESQNTVGELSTNKLYVTEKGLVNITTASNVRDNMSENEVRTKKMYVTEKGLVNITVTGNVLDKRSQNEASTKIIVSEKSINNDAATTPSVKVLEKSKLDKNLLPVDTSNIAEIQTVNTTSPKKNSSVCNVEKVSPQDVVQPLNVSLPVKVNNSLVDDHTNEILISKEIKPSEINLQNDTTQVMHTDSDPKTQLTCGDDMTNTSASASIIGDKPSVNTTVLKLSNLPSDLDASNDKPQTMVQLAKKNTLMHSLGRKNKEVDSDDAILLNSSTNDSTEEPMEVDGDSEMDDYLLADVEVQNKEIEHDTGETRNELDHLAMKGITANNMEKPVTGIEVSESTSHLPVISLQLPKKTTDIEETNSEKTDSPVPEPTKAHISIPQTLLHTIENKDTSLIPVSPAEKADAGEPSIIKAKTGNEPETVAKQINSDIPNTSEKDQIKPAVTAIDTEAIFTQNKTLISDSKEILNDSVKHSHASNTKEIVAESKTCYSIEREMPKLQTVQAVPPSSKEPSDMPTASFNDLSLAASSSTYVSEIGSKASSTSKSTDSLEKIVPEKSLLSTQVSEDQSKNSSRSATPTVDGVDVIELSSDEDANNAATASAKPKTKKKKGKSKSSTDLQVSGKTGKRSASPMSVDEKENKKAKLDATEGASEELTLLSPNISRQELVTKLFECKMRQHLKRVNEFAARAKSLQAQLEAVDNSRQRWQMESTRLQIKVHELNEQNEILRSKRSEVPSKGVVTTGTQYDRQDVLQAQQLLASKQALPHLPPAHTPSTSQHHMSTNNEPASTGTSGVASRSGVSDTSKSNQQSGLMTSMVSSTPPTRPPNAPPTPASIPGGGSKMPNTQGSTPTKQTRPTAALATKPGDVRSKSSATRRPSNGSQATPNAPVAVIDLTDDDDAAAAAQRNRVPPLNPIRTPPVTQPSRMIQQNAVPKGSAQNRVTPPRPIQSGPKPGPIVVPNILIRSKTGPQQAPIQTAASQLQEFRQAAQRQQEQQQIMQQQRQVPAQQVVQQQRQVQQQVQQPQRSVAAQQVSPNVQVVHTSQARVSPMQQSLHATSKSVTMTTQGGTRQIVSLPSSNHLAATTSRTAAAPQQLLQHQGQQQQVVQQQVLQQQASVVQQQLVQRQVVPPGQTAQIIQTPQGHQVVMTSVSSGMTTVLAGQPIQAGTLHPGQVTTYQIQAVPGQTIQGTPTVQQMIMQQQPIRTSQVVQQQQQQQVATRFTAPTNTVAPSGVQGGHVVHHRGNDTTRPPPHSATRPTHPNAPLPPPYHQQQRRPTFSDPGTVRAMAAPPVPASSEQQQHVAQIQAQTAQYEALAQNMQQNIQKLKEEDAPFEKRRIEILKQLQVNLGTYRTQDLHMQLRHIQNEQARIQTESKNKVNLLQQYLHSKHQLQQSLQQHQRQQVVQQSQQQQAVQQSQQQQPVQSMLQQQQVQVSTANRPAVTRIAVPTAASSPSGQVALIRRHPAPLPSVPSSAATVQSNAAPPPKPTLSISKVNQGIVLSWNMSINGAVHAAIDCYNLYAYQETDALPNTNLWKKIGDVKALPLPMACTLTQFQPGSMYHFAVCAIDVYHRTGPFSDPSSINLPAI